MFIKIQVVFFIPPGKQAGKVPSQVEVGGFIVKLHADDNAGANPVNGVRGDRYRGNTGIFHRLGGNIEHQKVLGQHVFDFAGGNTEFTNGHGYVVQKTAGFHSAFENAFSCTVISFPPVFGDIFKYGFAV